MRGTKYDRIHFSQCWVCEEGVMVSTGRGRDILDANISSHHVVCRNDGCENRFRLDTNQVKSIGIPRGSNLSDNISDIKTYGEMMELTQKRDDIVFMDFPRQGPQYYVLTKGDDCPVSNCGGSVRQVGGGMTVKYSCNSCDYETFEKDVS